MMNNEFLVLLRDLIKAEVEAGIAGFTPGDDGYYGYNGAQEKVADKIFEELKESVKLTEFNNKEFDRYAALAIDDHAKTLEGLLQR